MESSNYPSLEILILKRLGIYQINERILFVFTNIIH